MTEGEILFDHYMAMNPGYVEEEITGITVLPPAGNLDHGEPERACGEPWLYGGGSAVDHCDASDPEAIRSHIAELLTRQDVQNLVNNLKESNPVLVDELVPKLLGLGEIQKVLQNLLSEGISIRDMLTIFETLADHAPATRDTDALTEYARQKALKARDLQQIFPGE